MSRPTSTTKAGFSGDIGSMPLVDLLQVWSANGFAGLVSITFEGRVGKLHFVDGEIVHAEADGLSGEPAVQAIIGWPGGAFELFPNTAVLHRTIEKGLRHLLLDAHHALDERRRSAAPPASLAAPAPREQPRPSALDQIRAIAGVTQVAHFGRDGRPPGQQGSDAEQLAAKGLYLAVTHAAAIGAAFGLGELAIAALRGERESFVLVHRGGNYLGVGVAPGAPVEPIVGQLRALLVRKAAT
jgi:uncharacterized protein DUF4388